MYLIFKLLTKYDIILRGDEMKKLKIWITTLVTFVLAFFLVGFFSTKETSVQAEPKTLYQVYLGGEKIGITDSKTALEKYIDNEQKEIKEQYRVKTVYPPNNLYVEKYISYQEHVYTAKEIYEMIKKKSPFTIKGYKITIKNETPMSLYVLDDKMFEKAVTRTIEAFISKEELKNFKNGTQPEIKTTGQLIEDLYINEDIIVKQMYISTDQKIFTNEDELTRFLLFNSVKEQQKYIVKLGDTIEDIAFNNKLGVNEFMVVNPNLDTSNSLLYPGQSVNIGLINPIFQVVVEKHIVEDQNINFTTTYEEDATLAAGRTYVKQEGAYGTQRVVQKMKQINGEIVAVVFPSYEVIKPATNKIVVRGTKTSYGGYVLPVNESGWQWPTRSPYIISSSFGWRWGRMHSGIDITGTGYGSPIYASKPGVVHKASYDSAYGYYIMINHQNGYYTNYAHLSKQYVREGQQVKQGQVIGAMGNSGRSTGTHVHFEVFNGEPFAGGVVRFNPLLLYK